MVGLIQVTNMKYFEEKHIYWSMCKIYKTTDQGKILAGWQKSIIPNKYISMHVDKRCKFKLSNINDCLYSELTEEEVFERML